MRSTIAVRIIIFKKETGASMKIQEGYMPFHEYKTYYRIVGEPSADKAPLLLIHGGP
ncbi:alpha/beta hydrolase, partial [Lacticaseibacillus paracasei]